MKEAINKIKESEDTITDFIESELTALIENYQTKYEQKHIASALQIKKAEIRNEIKGLKEVYTDLARQGKVKEHEDSCCNETLDDVLSLKSLQK